MRNPLILVCVFLLVSSYPVVSVVWVRPLNITGSANYTDTQARDAINNSGSFNFLGLQSIGTILGNSSSDFVFSLARETTLTTFTSAAKLITVPTTGATIGSGGGLLFGYRNRTEAGNVEHFLGSVGTQVWNNSLTGEVVVNTYNNGVFQNTLHVTPDQKLSVNQAIPTGTVSIRTLDSSPENASVGRYALTLTYPFSTNGAYVGQCFRISSSYQDPVTCGAAIVHERTGSNDIGNLWFETSSGAGENLSIKGGFTSGGGLCVGPRAYCGFARERLSVNGDINLTGQLYAGVSATLNCSSQNEGAIIYNASSHVHLGCNSTKWNVMYR